MRRYQCLLVAVLSALWAQCVHSATQAQRTDMAAHIIGLNMAMLEVRLHCILTKRTL